MNRALHHEPGELCFCFVELKDAISLSAFTISVFLAGVKSYEVYNDRIQLKLKATFSKQRTRDKGQFVALKIEVINRGRRVAYITEIGVRMSASCPEVGKTIPETLTFEGEEAIQLLEAQRKKFVYEIPESALDGFGETATVYAVLSTGKTKTTKAKAVTKAEWEKHLALTEKKDMAALFDLETGTTTAYPINKTKSPDQ